MRIRDRTKTCLMSFSSIVFRSKKGKYLDKYNLENIREKGNCICKNSKCLCEICDLRDLLFCFFRVKIHYNTDEKSTKNAKVRVISL